MQNLPPSPPCYQDGKPPTHRAEKSKHQELPRDTIGNKPGIISRFAVRASQSLAASRRFANSLETKTGTYSESVPIVVDLHPTPVDGKKDKKIRPLAKSSSIET